MTTQEASTKAEETQSRSRALIVAVVGTTRVRKDWIT